MRVKPVDPNAVIRDPHTKRALPAEGDDVPDNVFWNRTRLDRRRDRARRNESAQPVGNEPIAPLTTR